MGFLSAARKATSSHWQAGAVSKGRCKKCLHLTQNLRCLQSYCSDVQTQVLLRRWGSFAHQGHLERAAGAGAKHRRQARVQI